MTLRGIAAIIFTLSSLVASTATLIAVLKTGRKIDDTHESVLNTKRKVDVAASISEDTNKVVRDALNGGNHT